MLETLLPEARAHYRRNFALGVANGAIFALAEALQDPTLVLSVFIHRLTGSSLLVGLLMPLSVGGWYLPQLLLSGRVQASPRKMPYYRSSGVGRIVANVGLALSALLVRDPRLLVLLLFLMVATNTLSGGMSGLAFTSIVGKVIPSRRRGRFFALRLFIGGALVFAGSLLARRLLAEPPGFAFPINYAVLFGISAAAVIVSFFCLSAVREPADLSVRPRVGVLAQLRRAADLPKRNRSYRGFLIARSCLMLAEVAAPFYIIYAGERFGVPESLAGTYLLVAALANMASTYLWARVSDNVGNRDVLRLAAAGGALSTGTGARGGSAARRIVRWRRHRRLRRPLRLTGRLPHRHVHRRHQLPARCLPHRRPYYLHWPDQHPGRSCLACHCCWRCSHRAGRLQPALRPGARALPHRGDRDHPGWRTAHRARARLRGAAYRRPPRALGVRRVHPVHRVHSVH